MANINEKGSRLTHHIDETERLGARGPAERKRHQERGGGRGRGMQRSMQWDGCLPCHYSVARVVALPRNEEAFE